MNGSSIICTGCLSIVIIMVAALIAPAIQAANEPPGMVESDATNKGSILALNNAESDSGPAFLVKDINPMGHAELGGFCDGDGVFYFSADDSTHGQERWKSDGTQEGTMMVKDIAPGSGSSSGINVCFFFNNEVYFVANDGTHGSELWKSDGAESGTLMVKDINPGSNSSFPSEFQVIGTTLYFFADDGINGRELWKSDGTESGTEMVKDMNASESSVSGKLTNANGVLYFSADDGIHGIELWKSDGTEANTEMVKDINPSESSFAQIKAYEIDTIYLYANDGTNGYELWVSDGTEIGTKLVEDIRPGTAGSYWYYGFYITNGSNLFFTADDGTHGIRLWTSDGTKTGTKLLGDINPGGFDCFYGCIYTIIDELLIFDGGNSSNGSELWVSNGTEAGTKMVKDINPGTEAGISCYWNCSWINAGGILYFAASDGINGRELWKSDGTEAGTVMVKDINPFLTDDESSTGPRVGNYINNVLYFSADDGTHGYELWQTDGTESDTEMVQDINPGLPDSMAGGLTVSGSNIFFTADDGIHGGELWVLPGVIDVSTDIFLPIIVSK